MRRWNLVAPRVLLQRGVGDNAKNDEINVMRNIGDIVIVDRAPILFQERSSTNEARQHTFYRIGGRCRRRNIESELCR